ncbi:MAG TPA: DUF4258 domain-containing protein [Candidatus Binatia bacterium]
MDYELTEHARESLRKRPVIRREWLDRVLEHATLVEPDQVDPELEHRLGRIDEHGGRVLRVIVNRARVPLRVVTVYFDRKMRGRL